jgi:hypothetical protein
MAFPRDERPSSRDLNAEIPVDVDVAALRDAQTSGVVTPHTGHPENTPPTDQTSSR